MARYRDDKDKAPCPRCKSTIFRRRGKSSNGKQQYECIDCKRRYVYKHFKKWTCPYCGQFQEAVVETTSHYREPWTTCERCHAKFAKDPDKTGLLCRDCGSDRVVRNGKERSGSQKLACRACGRKFVDAPKRGPVSSHSKQLIHVEVTEPAASRKGTRRIAKYARVSRRWLQRYLKGAYHKDYPNSTPHLSCEERRQADEWENFFYY